MNNKTIYNEWYWQILTIPATKRIIACWKNENRDISFPFEQTNSQEDFGEVITYLHKWRQERSNIEESLKRDIGIVSAFEGYPTITTN